MRCHNGSGGWWLKVPVGKLRTDRHVPLHPVLVELLADWQARHRPIDGLLLSNRARPLNRHAVTRMVNSVARRAGLGHINPHRLRHTLATQAVNRGMRVEAVAELLGHRDLRMTMRYARIANATVAAEYRNVSDKVDALYTEPDELPETPSMRRLRREHYRLLANGWCTRPRDLDCSFEAICEGCGHFATAVEFTPVLERQRDHAATHGQPRRQAIYQQLLDGLEGHCCIEAARGCQAFVDSDEAASWRVEMGCFAAVLTPFRTACRVAEVRFAPNATVPSSALPAASKRQSDPCFLPSPVWPGSGSTVASSPAGLSARCTGLPCGGPSYRTTVSIAAPCDCWAEALGGTTPFPDTTLGSPDPASSCRRMHWSRAPARGRCETRRSMGPCLARTSTGWHLVLHRASLLALCLVGRNAAGRAVATTTMIYPPIVVSTSDLG
jgi:hypothetical protein